MLGTACHEGFWEMKISGMCLELTGKPLQVLRQFMLLPEAEIEELDGLARRVHTAAMEKQQEEELLQVRFLTPGSSDSKVMFTPKYTYKGLRLS